MLWFMFGFVFINVSLGYSTLIIIELTNFPKRSIPIWILGSNYTTTHQPLTIRSVFHHTLYCYILLISFCMYLLRQQLFFLLHCLVIILKMIALFNSVYVNQNQRCYVMLCLHGTLNSFVYWNLTFFFWIPMHFALMSVWELDLRVGPEYDPQLIKMTLNKNRTVCWALKYKNGYPIAVCKNYTAFIKG